MPAKTTGFYKTFKCKICGKSVTKWVFQSALKQNKTFEFCSRKCANARQIRPDIPCAYCGKMFHPSKDARYCAHECFALSTRGRKANNAHPSSVIEYVLNKYENSFPEEIANTLGITIGAVRQIAYNHGKKINPEEKRKHIQKATAHHMKGENNPNWHGGITCHEWGTNWIRQRRVVLARDNYTCQSCGKPGRNVHHINPRRNFTKDNINLSNRSKNLITLCSSCHNLVECGKLPCPVPNQSPLLSCPSITKIIF